VEGTTERIHGLPVRLLALDPSIRSCGLAVFETHGYSTPLVWSGRILVESDGDIGTRCLRMAGTIRFELRRVRLEPDSLIFEWPQIYTAAKSKGDPNDLIAMAGVGSALAASLDTLTSLHTPQPGDWIRVPKVCPACKGRASKKCRMCKGSSWGTPRGRLIAESLTDGERVMVHDQHDEIDAVGLGLWKLKRLVTRRVFPGAV
jgi:hypothetical protein